jgi:hypothetical protein
MPNIAHFLYKNLILKIVRLWEHGHFVGILGLENHLNGKVIFEFFSLSFFLFLSHIYNYSNQIQRENYIQQKKLRRIN